MGRGARRAPIFRDDRSCSLFLASLAELPERFDVGVHGFALMPNHYHLMLESRRGNLSRAMAFLLSRFTVGVNRLHESWDGPVFRGRFHNRVVYLDQHWTHLLCYVHLNPVRARLVVTPEQARWTSHAYYDGVEPPTWLTTSELLEMFEPLGGYARYLRDLRAHRGEVPEGFDSVAFRGGRRMSDETVKEPPARPRKPPAREILAAVAREAGVPVSALARSAFGPTGNPARLVAAHLLSCLGGLTHREVGRLLDMSDYNVSKALRKVRARRGSGDELTRIVEALEKSGWRVASGRV
jgi:REP element-mobilizing transposase RayT